VEGVVRECDDQFAGAHLSVVADARLHGTRRDPFYNTRRQCYCRRELTRDSVIVNLRMGGTDFEQYPAMKPAPVCSFFFLSTSSSVFMLAACCSCRMGILIQHLAIIYLKDRVLAEVHERL